MNKIKLYDNLHAFKTLFFRIHDSKGGGLRLHAFRLTH